MAIRLAKKNSIIYFFTMLFWVLCSSSGWGAESQIETVKLKLTQLVQGWKLIHEYPVQADEIKRFEARFVASIDEMLNQVFVIENLGEVRINYLTGHSEYHANLIYSGIMQLAGDQNTIVRKGNVIVEIISEHHPIKPEIVKMLGLSALQSRKLTSAAVPEDWRLVKEYFIEPDEVKTFEQKFNAKIEEMINQFFLIDKERVQINYIACLTEQDAEIAYNALSKMTGHVNRVIKIDRIVAEIITRNSEIKQALEKALRNI